jgi:hypothetical protein
MHLAKNDNRKRKDQLDIEQNNRKNNENEEITRINGQHRNVNEYLEAIFGPSLHLTNVNLTWKNRIKEFLNSQHLHVAIIILVIIDCLCVTLELILEIQNKESESETIEIFAKLFKYIGFIILCMFTIEIALKIFFTFHHFIRSKLEMLDSCIVIVSLVLEIVFISENNSLSAIGGILSIFRLWRIIRIVNGNFLRKDLFKLEGRLNI